MPVSTLEALSRNLEDAKREEKEAKIKVADAERAILEQLNLDPDTEEPGTKSFDIDNGKLKINFKDTRSWNQAQLEVLRESVPDDWWPFKKEWKEERTKTRALETVRNNFWGIISGALTTKPSKPSITITRKND